MRSLDVLHIRKLCFATRIQGNWGADCAAHLLTVSLEDRAFHSFANTLRPFSDVSS